MDEAGSGAAEAVLVVGVATASPEAEVIAAATVAGAAEALRLTSQEISTKVSITIASQSRRMGLYDNSKTALADEKARVTAVAFWRIGNGKRIHSVYSSIILPPLWNAPNDIQLLSSCY